jgi:membrane associated rhomboid family serine protease
MQRPQMGGGFNINLTPLARNTLIVLVSIYVVQLVTIHWLHLPIREWLYLWPIGSGNWRPWQPLTSLLLNFDTSPMVAVFDWLMIYFFAGTVEGMLGRKRYLQALGVSVAVAVVITTLLDFAGALAAGQPAVGLNPIVTALVVLFGLSIPHARILLMFVLPIKAGWVAWGTGLFSLLYFLINRDLGSSMALFGWVGAWAWMNSGNLTGRLKSRKRAKDLEKDLSRFKVYEGGKDNDEYIH